MAHREMSCEKMYFFYNGYEPSRSVKLTRSKKGRSFTKLLVGAHVYSYCMPTVPRKYHPPVLRHHRLATALAALQVLLGIAVTSLAVWLLVWAPNLRVRDIPYWSGLPVSSTLF